MEVSLSWAAAKSPNSKRELLDEYHKQVTKEALEPLYNLFMDWKQGTLPYYELTEQIHLFHKRNQEIFTDFNYTERDDLVLLAKMKLGRLSEEDIAEHEWILERWGYNVANDKQSHQ